MLRSRSTRRPAPDVTYGSSSHAGVHAGGFALRGDIDGDSAVEDFVAFCLDISTYISNGKNYEVTTSPFAVDPLTSLQIGNIQRLFNTAYRTLVLTSNTQSAGFQLALWEIIYETDSTLTLGSGNFTASYGTAAINFANTLLGNLGDTPTAHYALTFLQANPAHHPEPGDRLASAAAGGGADAAGRARRPRRARRRRKAA